MSEIVNLAPRSTSLVAFSLLLPSILGGVLFAVNVPTQVLVFICLFILIVLPIIISYYARFEVMRVEIAGEKFTLVFANTLAFKKKPLTLRRKEVDVVEVGDSLNVVFEGAKVAVLRQRAAGVVEWKMLRGYLLEMAKLDTGGGWSTYEFQVSPLQRSMKYIIPMAVIYGVFLVFTGGYEGIRIVAMVQRFIFAAIFVVLVVSRNIVQSVQVNRRYVIFITLWGGLLPWLKKRYPREDLEIGLNGDRLDVKYKGRKLPVVRPDGISREDWSRLLEELDYPSPSS